VRTLNCAIGARLVQQIARKLPKTNDIDGRYTGKAVVSLK